MFEKIIQSGSSADSLFFSRDLTLCPGTVRLILILILIRCSSSPIMKTRLKDSTPGSLTDAQATGGEQAQKQQADQNFATGVTLARRSRDRAIAILDQPS